MIRTGSTLAHIVLGLLLGATSLAAQDFSLRAGDAIKVLVPREIDLSGTFDVDPAGAITLPLVGRVQVGGKPWTEVSPVLLAAYRHELREMDISLTPLRRVVVLGAVNRPGSYLVEPTVTMSGAIAAASGAGSDGSLRRIRVVRGDTAFQPKVDHTREIADVPLESGDQIFVLQRNWFARNNAFLITALLSVTGIIATLGRRF